MRARQTTQLLNAVIGAQPTLAKIAQGYGRVATSAHPLCTCYGTAWSTCPQHVGIRANTRYAQTVVPSEPVEEMAA